MLLRYESKIYLEDYCNSYPDFIILDKNTKKEIYWEHFGIMDNYEYLNRFVEKIEAYPLSDIFLGSNLTTTFEYSGHTLDISYTEKIISQFI